LFSRDEMPTVLLDKVERIFKEFKVKIVVNYSGGALKDYVDLYFVLKDKYVGI